MSKADNLAVGHTESINACGAEVSPQNTSTTSVGMTGRQSVKKQESHSFRCGSVKNAILTYKFSHYGIVCFLVALSMIFAPFVSANFEEGLVLNHHYDEGEGTLAADASGHGHDGEISNPEWVDGKFGKALRFGGEGSDVFVTVESTAALNVNQCTFMAWINADHWNGTRQLVGKSVHGGCTGRTQYGLFSESGVFKLRFETENGRADISTDLPPTGEWVHIAFTNDGAMAKIYINGSSVVEGAVPGPLKANDDPWRIGQDCERLNYVFAGAIDEVRLWNRALTTADIGELMPSAVAVDARGKLATTWSSIKTVH